MTPQKNKPILALTVAASLLGIQPRTLMLYEKEGLIAPHRTPTSRRLFSRSNLTEIQFIQYLINQKRVNVAGAKVLLDLLEKAFEKYPNLKADFFPDYSPKELI